MILVLLELGNVSLPIMSLDFQAYRKFTFLKNIIWLQTRTKRNVLFSRKTNHSHYIFLLFPYHHNMRVSFNFIL